MIRDSETSVSVYEQIVWPTRFTREVVKDDNKFELVKLLCKISEDIIWKNEDNGFNYPDSYLVENIIVKFDPSCGFVKVGENLLPIPDMENEESVYVFLEIIDYASRIQSLALKLAK